MTGGAVRDPSPTPAPEASHSPANGGSCGTPKIDDDDAFGVIAPTGAEIELWDASHTRVDASHGAPESGESAGLIETDGWRLLSRGRDRTGRVRLQMALGSGRSRVWDGPALLLEDLSDEQLKERNEREATYQAGRRRLAAEGRAGLGE